MGLRPTHRDENRIESRSFTIELAWNGKGRNDPGAVKAVIDACKEGKDEAHQSRSPEAHLRGGQTALGGKEGCSRGTGKVAGHPATNMNWRRPETLSLNPLL